MIILMAASFWKMETLVRMVGTALQIEGRPCLEGELRETGFVCRAGSCRTTTRRIHGHS
jgi:hypothetical protein